VDLDYEKCLQKFIDEKVQYVNISMASETLSDKEVLLFKQLDQKGVKITVGAGNNGKEVTDNSLCALPLKNKICVGAGTKEERKPYSNFGKYVLAFTDDNNFQTSGASPYYLGKLINKDLK